MGKPVKRLVAKSKETGEYQDIGAIWENDGKNGVFLSFSSKYNAEYDGKAPNDLKALIKALEKLGGKYFFNVVDAGRKKADAKEEEDDDFLAGLDDE